MRPKSLILLLLALGCGLIAAIGVAQAVATLGGSQPAETGDEGPVAVAIADIGQGDSIRKEVVRIEQWPIDKIPEGAITKLEDLEERRARGRIVSGMLIHDKHLTAKGVGGENEAAIQIKPGYRVVAVKSDVVASTGSLLKPGDHVDVLVLTQAGREFDETITKTIIQNAVVFAVNDIYEFTGVDEPRSIKAQTVSLMLPPEQIERLMMASEMGKIRLALRNPEDKETHELPGSAPESLLGSHAEEEDQLTMDKLTEMLATAGQQGQAPQEGETEEPQKEQFVMKVIAGGKISNVVMELDEPLMPTSLDEPVEGENTEDDAQSEEDSFSIWSIMPSYGQGNDVEPDESGADETGQDDEPSPETSPSTNEEGSAPQIVL